jgi:hypothetical protein
MRRLLLVLLLPVSACAGEKPSEMSFPAAELKDFILRINHGPVIVRNHRKGEKSDVCVLRLKESGGKEVLGADKRFNASVTKKRVRLQQRRNEPGLRLEIELVVPKGIDLDVNVREGGIRLEGEFGMVKATCTDGDVVADPVRVAGGTLKTFTGAAKLVLGKGALRADLSCETMEGEATVRLADDFRGPIHLLSGVGKIDYGKNPKVRLRIDAEKKHALGFAGRRMTAEEQTAAAQGGKTPPGVWGKSQKGKVVFRMGDDE